MPTDSLIDAVMIFVAGALLLTPGILTDIFGLSLLVPICRRFYRSRAKKWFRDRFQVTSFAGTSDPGFGESKVIDSYVVESNENDGGGQT